MGVILLLNNRYRILRKIGEGGYGVVYLAEDILKKKHIALKKLNPDFANDKHYEALKNEFDALTRLQHPNLIQIFDLEIIKESGELFLTMEYLEGQNLLEISNSRNQQELIDIVIQICRALDYIHNKGIVHRDIKPENIFIIGGREKPTIKLMDFGLARHMKSSKKEIGGTLFYSAPEILSGKKPDGRSDLYALGIILYLISFGQYPFPTETAADVVNWHLHGEVPSRPQPRANVPSYFPELISLLLRKDPSMRTDKAQKIIDFIRTKSGLKLGLETKETIESYFKSADFVGRKHEFERIFSLIDIIKHPSSRKKHPSPTLMLIEGESGVGKSRLLREIKNRCQLEGLDVIQGHCYEGTASPYGPFKEVLNSALLLAHSIQKAKKEEGMRLEKYFQVAANFISSPDRISTSDIDDHEEIEQEKLRLVDTLTEFLTRISESFPLVIFIEDIQWCDESTLFMLDFLARNSEGKRLLIAATLRKEETVSGPIRTFLSKSTLVPFTERIDLCRLQKSDVTELISSMLGTNENVDSLAERIFGGTEGNPLFIEEVMKNVAEDVGADTVLGWQEKVLQYQEAIKIPATIKEAIRKRIERLDEESLSVLRYLSIIDKPAPLAFMEKLTLRGKEKLGTIVENLKGKGIMKPESDGKNLVAFNHNLFKEYIAQSMSLDECKKLHAEIGKAFLDLQDHETFVEELAYHFVKAEDNDRAVAFSLQAAERASNLYAHDRAIVHYRNALQFTPQDSIDNRIGVLLKLSEATLESGTIENAIPSLEEAMVLSKSRNLPEREAAVHERLGWAYCLSGRLDLGKEFSENALRQYSNLKDKAGMAKASNNLGLANARMGLFKPALDCFLTSLKFWEDIKNNFYAVNTINNIGLTYFYSGNFQRSIRFLIRAHEESKMQNHTRMIIASLNNLGIVYKKMNLRDKAVECYEKCNKIAHEIGDKLDIAGTYHNLGELSKTEANYENSISFIRKAAEIVERVGHQNGLAFYLDCLGNIYQIIGMVEQAKRLHERALSLSVECGNKIQQGYSYLALSGDYLLEENINESRALLDRALKLSDELDNNRLKFKSFIKVMALHNAEGNYESTLKTFRRFEQLAVKGLLDIEDITEGRLLFAEALIKSRKSNDARIMLEEVLKDTEEQDLKEFKWLALYNLALALKEENKEYEAINLVKKAKETVHSIASSIQDEQLRKSYLNHPKRKRLFSLSESLGEGIAMLSEMQHGEMKTPPLKMLTTLYEIVQMINSILDPDELLDKLMDLTIDVVGAERGLIILIDEDTGEMSVRVARNLEKETIKDASRYSHSIVKEAESGKSILTIDAANDERFKRSKSVSLYNIRSLMCVPLKLQNRIIGTVYLDSRRSGPLFSKEDLSFIEALANHASIAIEKAQLYARLKRENKLLKDVAHQRYQFDNIIGKSDGMKNVFSMIERVIDSPLPVLIIGESGTGKELVARAVHFNGPRKNNIFLSENCSAISETLLESELFGHIRGAFTGAIHDRKGLFEIAKDGTLFLDEIGDMSLSMQSKLLRALQEGEIRPVGSKKIIRVNPRIISASNKDLKKLMEEKKFREDLYYRLDVIQINLPPLRERREDIPLLTEHFLKKAAVEKKVPSLGIADDVMNLFINYRWPGNVREIENAVNRLTLIASKNFIDMKTLKTDRDLYAVFTEKMPVPVFGGAAAEKTSRLKTGSLKNHEKEMIVSALEESRGNRVDAAKILGVSRATIFRKIKEYGIK